MLTRSGKTVPYLPSPRKSSPVKRRALAPEATVEMVTASKTGQGTHKRWVRTRETSPYYRATKVVDPALDVRYTTPEPTIPTEAPPMGKRRPKFVRPPLQKQDRIGFPGIQGLGVWKRDVYILDENEEDVDVFGTPSESSQIRRARVHLGLGPRMQGQPMVGPEGTLILDKQSQPLFPSPPRRAGGSSRPLVHVDTVII